MNNKALRTLLLRSIAAGIGLAAAQAPAVASDFLAATRPVIAIVNGELFVGEAIGHLDGAGTIAMHAQLNPSLTCVGEFTSSAKEGGHGNMRCSDGAIASFQFQRLNIYRGYGAGDTTRGAMSFAYGLTSEEAVHYLRLPGGKKFSPPGTELTLVDQ